MIKRTLLFSTPCYLGVKNGQIRFKPREAEKKEQVIPLEDVGFVVLENPAITLSLQLIEKLNANGTAMIFCDSTHMPASMLQSFSGNQTHAEVIRAQVETTLPLKKQIWKEIVRQKILNQAELLKGREMEGHQRLFRLANEVKSGDSDNREGTAARKYWQCLIKDPTFKREREGDAPNSLLNYGYAILRAATARALVSSGLYCALGVHHRNKYNAFALADDVMEPYRPFVDRIVCQLLDEGPQDETLTPAIKQSLLKVLTVDTQINGQRSPLMVALSSTTASLSRCFVAKNSKLMLPAMQ